jgi:hypothetical protein
MKTIDQPITLRWLLIAVALLTALLITVYVARTRKEPGTPVQAPKTNAGVLESKNAVLVAENKKWVPKTWVGRQLRYIERGAAIAFVGAVGILVLMK